MSTAAHARVVVDGVWKQFRRGERHETLRDLLPAAFRRVLGRKRTPQSSEAFWALRDVSFEVLPGQVLGIIGPNGAGKSTMLKLLSGVLRPSTGRVEIHGRIGALIDVAAGFHGDLTGRENLYLQGAILGMKRDEITRRFDEIVAFAGIDDFIDTPVKRYSSGMSARLGFAVAAHLDPDVLLVDEVLSVGDLAFQRKAEDRLRELVARQIPIVLVSHQLERVMALCERGILLAGGEVRFAGSAEACVAAYIEGEHLLGQSGAATAPIELLTTCAPPEPVIAGAQITVHITGTVRRQATDENITLGVSLRMLPEEEMLFATHTEACGVQLPQSGSFELEVDLTMNVGPGVYRVQPFLWDQHERKEIVRGPSALIHVEKRAEAFGRVDLQPQMRVSLS